MGLANVWNNLVETIDQTTGLLADTATGTRNVVKSSLDFMEESIQESMTSNTPSNKEETTDGKPFEL